ncbi:hypothetical protein C8N35_104217 [Breoghania corrubedonensis]|uniref:Uncharacterized protein n=1 Tax=Breoghania corrubedonensis TaxID=665038 RepID=A0A2T5VA08_9HYPH|nr:hypothetical protein [Breoghania corrubedonensis]PTW60592.1 hypothetical protein C8N35_104217 [Breoghania corrubedonensis]
MPTMTLNSDLTYAIEAKHFRRLAADLSHLNEHRQPPSLLRLAPTIEAWSTTLVPQAALIGSISDVAILEPLFALSLNDGWARLASGWANLGSHVDDLAGAEGDGGNHR